MKAPELTTAQHEALAYVAQHEGRAWKDALSKAWASGTVCEVARDPDMASTLVWLRNARSFGTRGLKSYKLPVKEAPVFLTLEDARSRALRAMLADRCTTEEAAEVVDGTEQRLLRKVAETSIRTGAATAHSVVAALAALYLVRLGYRIAPAE